MDINHIKKELSCNKLIFEQLFRSFNESARTWKLSQEKWNALEILCHLYDEEREDFRARIDHIFNKPNDTDMPKINPEGWVEIRNYKDQLFEQVLDKFLRERTASLIYLEEKKKEDWRKKFIHPYLKEVDPAFFLKNWLAHDYLHIRQLIRLKYDYLNQIDKNIQLNYAGVW